eukprot:scaffold422172_cov23-Prasinocladus_malaysianus.AAC.1
MPSGRSLLRRIRGGRSTVPPGTSRGPSTPPGTCWRRPSPGRGTLRGTGRAGRTRSRRTGRSGPNTRPPCSAPFCSAKMAKKTPMIIQWSQPK